MTKFRVVTEESLGSVTTFDVFKCVFVCRRHCQLDDRGQFVAIFENRAVLYFVVYKLCFI